MSFPAIMVLLVAITGLIWLVDRFWLAPQRPVSENEPAIVEYAKSFFPIILLVLVIRSFVAEPFRIPSSSMLPTLHVGDFILVNKFAYGIRLPVIDTKVIPIGDPQRGDVMVFRYPNNPSINYIKRVVGLPGDHIRYAGKQLYVNGQKVEHELVEIVPDDEVPAGHPLQTLANAAIYREQLGEVTHLIRQKQLSQTPKPKEWVVPQGYYFMMGDNRDNSNDSRSWGTVRLEEIKGPAFILYWSWDVNGNALQFFNPLNWISAEKRWDRVLQRVRCESPEEFKARTGTLSAGSD